MIDHVAMSHPHDDHGNMLDEVLACYGVKHIWEVGVEKDAVFYGQFLKAVAAEAGATYHTVVSPPGDRMRSVAGDDILIPTCVGWLTFADGDEQTLGAGAKFKVLHTDGHEHHDSNQNSLVLRLDLGDTSLLLTGDAESGGLEDPSEPAGDIERHLLDEHLTEIDVDVLQVGHHGSMTSSRGEFLDAVTPQWALVGVGPYKYGSVRLPDREVIDALKDRNVKILRTDADRPPSDDDEPACATADRIGMDNDRPGGCDNWVITVEP